MKKILSTPFFCTCFMASVIAEVYLIHSDSEDLFSVVGIGIVLLITGYLLLDSIQSSIKKGIEATKFYFDQTYREESEKWSERYTEQMNIQKASYSAMKKNTVTMSVQFEEVLGRLEAMENTLYKSLYTMTELQKRALEGQKNALNFEINYSKENTKQLIEALRQESDRTNTSELLSKLLERMDRNNELLESQLESLQNRTFVSSSVVQTENTVEPISEDQKVIEVDWSTVAEQEAEKVTLTEWNTEIEEPVVDNLTEDGWDVDAEVVFGNPVTDGWDITNAQEYLKEDTPGQSDSLLSDYSEEVEAESVVETKGEDNWINESDLNSLIEDWVIGENTPEAVVPEVTEQESEALQIAEDVIDSFETPELADQKPMITPLYDDPGKSLTADEIAKLFAAYGQ